MVEPGRPGRPGRNDPCPCGSGKKFKRCCLPVRQTQPRPQSADLTEAERREAALRPVREFARGLAQRARQEGAEILFFDLGGEPDDPEPAFAILDSRLWDWFLRASRAP